MTDKKRLGFESQNDSLIIDKPTDIELFRGQILAATDEEIGGYPLISVTAEDSESIPDTWNIELITAPLTAGEYANKKVSKSFKALKQSFNFVSPNTQYDTLEKIIDLYHEISDSELPMHLEKKYKFVPGPKIEENKLIEKQLPTFTIRRDYHASSEWWTQVNACMLFENLRHFPYLKVIASKNPDKMRFEDTPKWLVDTPKSHSTQTQREKGKENKLYSAWITHFSYCALSYFNTLMVYEKSQLVDDSYMASLKPLTYNVRYSNAQAIMQILDDKAIDILERNLPNSDASNKLSEIITNDSIEYYSDIYKPAERISIYKNWINGSLNDIREYVDLRKTYGKRTVYDYNRAQPYILTDNDIKVNLPTNAAESVSSLVSKKTYNKYVFPIFSMQ